MHGYDDKKITLIAGIISYTAVYVIIRYGLPLFAPFVAAYIFAWSLRPVVNFCVVRLRMKNGSAALVTLAVLSAVIIAIICSVGISTLSGLGKMVTVWSNCQKGIVKDIRQTCCYIENGMGLKDGILFERLGDYAENIDITHLTSKIMCGSVSAAVRSAQWLVFIIVVFIAAFYFIKDKNEMDEKRASSMFGMEINRIIGSIYTTGIAYLKAQMVIMVITFIVCFIGFYFAGIKYAAIYAGIVSVLDALPLLGTGLLILPVAAIYALKGRFVTAIIMTVVFALCYCIREILEPKIMGKNAGLSPVITMVAMYAGYKLFGLLGVITGPFAYIAAREFTDILMDAYNKNITRKV